MLVFLKPTQLNKICIKCADLFDCYKSKSLIGKTKIHFIPLKSVQLWYHNNRYNTGYMVAYA